MDFLGLWSFHTICRPVPGARGTGGSGGDQLPLKVVFMLILGGAPPRLPRPRTFKSIGPGA